MKPIRSDLAIEICGDILKHNPETSGIECNKSRCGPMELETVLIRNAEGESLSQKPIGRYWTLNTGRLWLDDRDTFRNKVLAFRDLIRSLFLEKIGTDGSVLVAGLGNEWITADAIGPQTVRNLMVTRHLKRERPAIFEDLGLFDLCAITPGVLGQTGIESADIVKSVVAGIRPELLLVIDSLASRELERLVTTIQLCDSGIRPGSGIGNARPALTPDALSIPVISIGVPTVVDAATLASDAMRRFAGTERDAEEIRKEWDKSNLNFFVTPKETDQIIRVMGSFIGYGINLALNPSLSFEEMLSLTDQ
ncbi:MAG: GPR endopeptidase [Clostridia bacterium]|nr:GPR endopeptidase [Clostridia bacterium]